MTERLHCPRCGTTWDAEDIYGHMCSGGTPTLGIDGVHGLPENMRCSLCCEPMATRSEIEVGVCEQCDPGGAASSELRRGT
jgi:hypothetical protein